MKNFGDAVRGMHPALERIFRDRQRQAQEFIAAGGTCFDCRDTGWTEVRAERHDPARVCPKCEAGVRNLALLRREVAIDLASSSPLTPLAMPLEGMRCRNAEQVAGLVRAWASGWREAWKEVTEQSSDQPFLLLHGPTGSGKTTTAATVAGLLATRMLMMPAYVNAKQAIDVMRERGHGRDPGPYRGEGAWLQKAPLLVDDLAIATHSDAAEGFHYSVVQDRYEKKWPTIFTTNASLEPNGGDRTMISRIGARAYWRIMERALVVTMDGYNWRDARQNKG